MNHIRRFYFSFVLVALLPSLGLAQPRANTFAQLMNSPSRPTMAQVIEAYTSDKNGVARTNNLSGNIQSLAFSIAILERAFPNAVFAPLGRDSATFGDILDGFYSSIGQAGRVSRLSGSGDTISNGNPEMLLQFMASAGLNLKHPLRHQPFVMIDATSYGSGSQSSTLMNVAYSYFERQQVARADLVHAVNFVNLREDRYKANILVPGFDFKTFFSRIEHPAQGRPSEILTLPVSQFTYGKEWHGSFGELARGPDGKVEGTLGALSSATDRQLILACQAGILDLVSTESFHRAVQAEAKKLEYEFPIDPTQWEKEQRKQELALQKQLDEEKKRASLSKKEYLADYEGRLKQYISGFSTPIEQLGQQYVSANAQGLIDLLNDEIAQLQRARNQNPNLSSLGNDQIVFGFVVAVIQAHKQGLILSRDFRRILAPAFSAMGTPTTNFLSHLSELVVKESFLRQELIARKEFFLTTYQHGKRAGTEGTAQNYTLIMNALGTRKKCADLLAKSA